MAFITTNLDQALQDLITGKPVAIPTETVYGLAAPIDNEKAIQAVFAIKNRPLNHPLIMHIGVNWDLNQWVTVVPDYAKALIKAFWPGPLTLVLPKRNNVSSQVTGGQPTVAIRAPAHPLTQALLDALQIPLVAPSANPFGKVSPTTAIHVEESFPEQALTILDGGRCSVGIESTIIDATEPESYRILRAGLLTEADLLRVAPCLIQGKLEEDIRVPGKLETHYQPKKILYYFDSYPLLETFCQQHPQQVFAMASEQPVTVETKHFHLLAKQPQQAAFDLYFQLRAADASSARWIATELPPVNADWQGVRERILKAGVSYKNIDSLREYE